MQQENFNTDWVLSCIKKLLLNYCHSLFFKSSYISEVSTEIFRAKMIWYWELVLKQPRNWGVGENIDEIRFARTW